MTLTISSLPAVEVGTQQHPILCPLRACPATRAARPVGAIWRVDVTGPTWRSTSVHRPGEIRPAATAWIAARHTLATHAVHEHDADHDDADLLLRFAYAAEDVTRTVLGAAPAERPEVAVACCEHCSTPLVRDEARDEWQDAVGGTVCIAHTRWCEQLCRPHHPNGADPACGECCGTGETYGLHEPVPNIGGTR